MRHQRLFLKAPGLKTAGKSGKESPAYTSIFSDTSSYLWMVGRNAPALSEKSKTVARFHSMDLKGLKPSAHAVLCHAINFGVPRKSRSYEKNHWTELAGGS